MEVFNPKPPDWIATATHAPKFCCPSCQASSTEATTAWIDRRSPVFVDNRRRKWQEFYHCHCGKVWWAWSDDRTPNEFADRLSSIDQVDRDDSDIDYDSFFGYF